MEYLAFLKASKNIDLSEQQKKAVQKVEGPVLLLAVPGSGKTTVVVARIGNMILNHKIDPAKIMNISFSVESAKDMAKRYGSIFGEEHLKHLQFRTIHSLCFKVIKDYERLNKRKGFDVMDQNTHVVRSILMDLYKAFPSEDTVQAVIQKIGYCKNMMLDDAKVSAIKIPECDFSEVYKAYESYKLENRLMDYDDMLVYALKILSSKQEVLQLYKDPCLYMNVDEAQDISVIQHEIISVLARPSGNLFMVGDEDQSIYGFRAAYPKALLHFKENYPGASILKMEQNFRSTKTIVSAANQVIFANHERFEKTMTTHNDIGMPIKQTPFKDLNSQYQYLSDLVAKQPENLTLAILFRNNESVIPIFDALERDKRKFNFKQSAGTFFTHFITRDLTCFFRLSLDPGDFESFEKIYFKLKCGLTKEMITELAQRQELDLFEAVSQLDAVNEAGKKRILLLKEKISKLKEFHAVKAIEMIEKDLGYTNYLTKLTKNGYSLGALQQKMNALKSIAMRCETPMLFMSRLEELEAYSRDPKYNHGEGVTLSTIHSSKGLEFDKVVLVDIIEGVLPSNESLAKHSEGDHSLYEEEVRLFYVALTRAKQEIEVITAKTLNRHPVQQSGFIDELFPKTKSNRQSMKSYITLDKKKQGAKIKVAITDNENLYAVGTRIKHKAFGEGVIESMEDEHIEVSFKNGIKRISLQVCIENGLIKRLE